jgi:hypothetical protein|tara:strand:- start:99 stop:842 length:744 start_codon:yes stop_codon:yes gene_type:complete
MLGITNQYRGTLRNYIIAFGTIFDDVDVERKNNAGVTQQIVRVPLGYGPAQKYLTRITNSAETSITLPRMSFEISGLQYDSSRKLVKTGGYSYQDPSDANKKKFVFNPVPYDIGITLSIMVKNAEDGTQILEQILPFFTPSFNLPIKEATDVGVIRDTPIILESVDTTDEYEGDYLTRRSLIWTLGFTIKGFIYASSERRETITKAVTNINNNPVKTQKYAKGEVTPDPTDALSTSDYGFSETITEY